MTKPLTRFALPLGAAALVCGISSAQSVGDFAPGSTIDCKFGTVRPTTGESFSLAGSPAVAVYKDNSTTESTSGVTLTADFDSRTGLNHVRITTASDGTFYSAGSTFDVVITSGTVDGVNVASQPVCTFSLDKTAALRPATAGRTFDVDSSGRAPVSVGTGTGQVNVSGGVVPANVTAISGDTGAADALELAFDADAGAVPMFGIARKGTAQSATSTTLVMDSGASFADDTLIGMTIVACGSTQGYCQSRVVKDNTGSSDTITVDAWEVTPSGTVTYYLFLTAGGTGELDLEALAEAMWTYNDRQLTALDEDVTSIDLNGTTVGTVNAIGTGGITANSIATDAITSDKIASSAVTELQTGLATASALATVDGIVDAIKAVTDALPDNGALSSLAQGSALATVDGIVDAVLVIAEKIDTMLEADDEDYRFTEGALSQAPVGEGAGASTIATAVWEYLLENCQSESGSVCEALAAAAVGGGGDGGTDWTADERTAIRTILGIPGSGTTPADPSSGILDTIRDAVAGLNDLSSADVEAAAQVGAAAAIAAHFRWPFTGTADGGDTSTLVDAELGAIFVNDVDLVGVYVVRADGQRCFVASYDASENAIDFGECTFTGAWTNQEYDIYPAGTQP